MEKEILNIVIPLIGPRGGKIPISLNKFKPSYKSKVPVWAVHVNARKWYEKHIPYTYEIKEPRANYREKRKVEITRIYGSPYKQLDEDNFKGGLKPLLDTLTNKGWIYNDDATHLECTYNQLKIPTEPDYGEDRELLMANQLRVEVIADISESVKSYNDPSNF